MKVVPRKAWEMGLQGCHVCNRFEALSEARCGRCNTALRARKPQSVQRTLALTVTATLLMVPAHAYPIMKVQTLGNVQESTIVDGVIALWQHGSYPIAVLIFMASVVVPIGKLLVLFWLVLSRRGLSLEEAEKKSWLYRMSHMAGPWSMVDVFVVAMLVGLVQVVGVMQIYPGFAIVSFAAMVVTTMLAANAFDERVIWDRVITQ